MWASSFSDAERLDDHPTCPDAAVLYDCLAVLQGRLADVVADYSDMALSKSATLVCAVDGEIAVIKQQIAETKRVLAKHNPITNPILRCVWLLIF